MSTSNFLLVMKTGNYQFLSSFILHKNINYINNIVKLYLFEATDQAYFIGRIGMLNITMVDYMRISKTVGWLVCPRTVGWLVGSGNSTSTY